MQTLIRKQNIPIPIDKAWEFFTSPANLKLITPNYLGFNIISAIGDESVYPGMIISYRVKPFLSIPITWVTEITYVSKMKYFIDNQKSGPYKYWHHQHIFKEIEGGTEMTDIVNYAAPFGWIGRLVERLLIKNQVKGIFQYRTKVLEELFA